MLDGNYLTTEIVQVVASNVTVADLTLREAYDHPIHVMPSASAATNGTLVYNVHVVDPGQQAIKVNPLGPGRPLRRRRHRGLLAHRDDRRRPRRASATTATPAASTPTPRGAGPCATT